MSYIVLMLAISITLVNAGLVFLVAWLISELLPDIIKKWRGHW
jgi:hypothetical protein